MGNTIFIKDKRVYIEHLKNMNGSHIKSKAIKDSKRLQVICMSRKLKSMFCVNLQKHLKPIYNLTIIGSPLIWTTIHQGSFEEIKTRLLQLPALYLLDNIERFQLLLNTRKLAAGSVLYQIQKWYY